MEVKTLDHFYSKKLKTDLLPPSKADQTKGKTLSVKWVAESLRPFTVVEDKGFRKFVQFLCNLHKQFSVPGWIKLRNQLVSYGELVREKMKEKLQNDVKYFSATTDIWSSKTMGSFMGPSERVFSDCGLALTAKRSRLKGNILRDQVMIRRNVPCLNITRDDIQTKFAKNK